MLVRLLQTVSLFTILAILAACGTPYGIYHTLKPTETLYRLSKTYNVSVEELMKINKIDDPTVLKIGDKIFIPGAEKELEMVTVTTENPQVYDNGQKDRNIVHERTQDEGRFIWPLKGKLFSRFEDSKQRRHDGIDISAPEGTGIRAAKSGRAIYSGSGIRGYGNIIIIKHADNYFTVYAHNKENKVIEGNYIKQGQIIGLVGKTGRAYGPHLHFEIRKGKKPVDPLNLLPK
ncbi:MAG TPA: LysM peptidoglycan-binding domain-containing M23 family metallopeptidase [bacterium]